MEYVWGLTGKSLVRGDQGLREKSGVRRAHVVAWENLERDHVGLSVHCGQACRIWGQNRGTVLVLERSTIHRVSACETGMSVQGGWGVHAVGA